MEETNKAIPKVKLINAMSKEQKAQVDSLLIADKPIPSEVLPLVLTFEECAGFSEAAIQKGLYRYKNKVIEPQQVLIAQKYSASNSPALNRVATNVRKLTAAFEPLRQLEILADRQLARVDKLAQLEENSPALLESQTKNIVAYAVILEKVAKLHQDLGILKHSAPVEYKGVGKDVSTFVRGATITPTTKQHYDEATTNALASLQARGLLTVKGTAPSSSGD